MPETQNPVSVTKPVKKFKLSKVALIVVVLLIFGLINSLIYYYFAVYQKQSRFPQVKSTVNASELKKKGFQEVQLKSNSAAFFVPSYWILIDEDLNVYGDSLNGANAYMTRNQNTLGILTKDVCGQITTEAEKTLGDKAIYNELKRSSFVTRKFGDFEGCFAEYKAKVGDKDFLINQFYIFREKTIYALTLHYPENIDYEKDNANTILASVILRDL